MLSYAEDIMTAVKTHTEANLSTFLSQIETEKDDGLTPSDVTAVYKGIRDPAKHNNFPVAFIIPVAEDYETLSMGSDLLTFTCHLWIIDSWSDEEVLTTRMARFAAAFKNMVAADLDLTSAVGETIVENVEYAPRIFGIETAQGVRIQMQIREEIS